jgi:RNA polymerase sigma-70 factor (ECF subfamily)
MPPLPLWYEGVDAFLLFLEKFLFRGASAGRYRALATTANGCPAFGAYGLDEKSGVHRPAALNVLVVDATRVAEVHSFLAMDTRLSFARFGLPQALD